ncbi:MAG: Resolvase domain protein [Myxococcales bacterium]|nr:Resolvase domain protein [Myxococcales bacterium]
MIPKRPARRATAPIANAIDAAMTFIKGTGHQMELEAIRGRVREALRARVRAGRIAGGRCFGYELKREADSSARVYTVAVVNEAEAEIVRRIFREYLDGAGIKRIAVPLNNDHVAPPRAGRRGTRDSRGSSSTLHATGWTAALRNRPARVRSSRRSRLSGTSSSERVERGATVPGQPAAPRSAALHDGRSNVVSPELGIATASDGRSSSARCRK